MLLSHGALNQVHDRKVLSSRHLKTWAQDSYFTSHKRKTFHSFHRLLHLWRDLTQELWTTANPNTFCSQARFCHSPLRTVTKKVVHLKQAGNCSMLTPTRSRQEALCTSFLQGERVGHTCEVLPVLQKAQSCSDTAALTNSHHAE